MKKLLIVLTILLFSTMAMAGGRYLVTNPDPNIKFLNLYDNMVILTENIPAQTDGSLCFDAWTLDTYGDKEYDLTATGMIEVGGRESPHSNLLEYTHRLPPAAPSGLGLGDSCNGSGD